MMHVVHIVRDLDVASGGPSRSVPALAVAQSKIPGVSVTVLYQERGNSVVPLENKGVVYRAIRAWDLMLGKALYKILWPGDTDRRETVFHLHGLWSPTLHWAARFALKNHMPYVISTRGMLAAWCLDHKSWKKKLGWWFYQQRDIEKAAVVMTSSTQEREDVLRLSGNEVVVIPNGCDERPEGIRGGDLLQGGAGVRWALAIGRLHPVKGFAELIDAWAALKPGGWRLAIAGPDEDGYRAKLQTLVNDHQLSEGVVLIGEVDDAQKWLLLDQCELLVAPSKSENFGMAIAEALQSGTPVITTTGTPWSDIVEYGCGWWVEQESSALIRALAEAIATDGMVLKDMGVKGRRLIAEKYSWGHIGHQTIDLYRSVILG